jgi:hypothetical protein
MPSDWYNKHATDIKSALTRANAASQDAPIPCTLMKMADGTFLLCAHISGGKAAALVKDARNNGCKIVSAGSLYQGEDGLTFAVTDGSAAVRMQFSAAARELTGKAMSVVVVAVEPAAKQPEAKAPAPVSDAAGARMTVLTCCGGVAGRSNRGPLWAV